jgi:hypothetical protein
MRLSSPFLYTAFNAVSTVYVGHQLGDMDIIWAGRTVYSRVLTRLHLALSHPVHSRSEIVLVTVLLLIAYEVV